MTRIQIHHVAALGSKADLSKDALQSICVVGNALAFISNNQAWFAPATSASLNPITLPHPSAAQPSSSSSSSAFQKPPPLNTNKLTVLALASFGRTTQDMAILIGDDRGFIYLASPSLQVCVVQRLWREPVQQIRVITADLGSPPEGELIPQTECFVVTFANAVVRIPAFEVLAALKTHKATGRLQQHRLAVDLWDLQELLGGGGQARLDAMCLGPCPVSVASLLHSPSLAAPTAASSEGELIVTVGEGLCLAGIVGEAAAQRSGSLIKFATGALQGVVGAISSAAGSSWLLGRLRGGGEASTSAPAPAQKGSSILGSLASAAAEEEEFRQLLQENPPKSCSMLFGMEDPPRSFRHIAVAPGKYSRTGALLDNLGRIFIVDLSSGMVLNVLKGYRDSQVAWTGGQTSSEPLHLLIAIPKHRALEAWLYEGGGSMKLAATLGHHVEEPAGTSSPSVPSPSAGDEDRKNRFPKAQDIQLVAPSLPFGCFGLKGGSAGVGPGVGKGAVPQLQRLPSTGHGSHGPRDTMPLMIYKTEDGVVHVARVEV